MNIVCIEEKIIGDTTGYRPYVSGLIVVLMGIAMSIYALLWYNTVQAVQQYPIL